MLSSNQLIYYDSFHCCAVNSQAQKVTLLSKVNYMEAILHVNKEI